MRLWLFFMLFAILSSANGQILIDEYFDDWGSDELRYTDNVGDVPSGNIDFQNLWISNDEEYLYLNFETGKEMNLQEGHRITLYLDFDNNITTGQIINGIGADLIYEFGDREGIMYLEGFLYFIGHFEIGLISLPTVSSDKFELAIKRNGSVGGENYNFSNTIKLYLEDEIANGDKTPDDVGGIEFSFDNSINQAEPEFSYAKTSNNHLRVLSYNSLFDGLFEAGQRDAQRRIIKAVNPDIIGFQEIYGTDANGVAQVIESLLPISGGGTWYGARVAPDIIVVSKYPIVALSPIDGNGAFKIDLGEKEMLLIVAHLPCCGNNFERQQEADNIIAFIREIKNGNGSFTLENGSPIIVMGDMNLVGDQRQQKTIVEGDILNESTYGPDIDPDWNGDPFEDIRFYNTGQPASITWFDAGSSFTPGRLDYMVYTGSVMTLENSFSVYTSTMSNSDLDDLGLNRFDSDISSDHLALIADFDLDLTSSISTSPVIENKALVFPNPAVDRLLIKCKPLSPLEGVLKIMNMNGEKIIEYKVKEYQENGDLQIPISQLESGLYFIEYQMQSKKYISSFIKIK